MLTTRCPHCSTTFRIRPEQLGVRGGRVRCGTCHTAFSALESLEEIPDDLPPQPSPPVQVTRIVTPVAPPPAATNRAAPAPAVADASVHAPKPELPAAPPVSPSPVLPAETAAAPDASSAASSEDKVDSKAEGASDGRKEPSLEPGWLAIDTDLPQGGFQHAVESSPLRNERPQVAMDLPTIDDAPPLIDPAKLGERTIAQPHPKKEPAPDFRMEFDLSAVKEEEAPAAKPSPTPAAEPYKSKVAEELGVAPFDSPQDDNLGLTYMLDDSVDEPPKASGRKVSSDEASLLYLRDQSHRSGKKRARVEDRRRRNRLWPWVLGVIFFAVLAGLQVAYLFRTEIARALPETRPYMEQACREFGCRVPYPKDPAQISIEGSNLVAEPSPEGHSRLIVTLRNKAGYAVAWPHLELTLTDKFDIATSRRVLKPTEWLPAEAARAAAFDGHTEITANILLATGKPDPSGYRIYTFYP